MKTHVIAWLNFAVLGVSTLLTLYFYVKSASPAALEKKIGQAYEEYRERTGLLIPKRR